jgi:hypothetical protein
VIESVGTWLTAQPADVGFFQDSLTKPVPLTGGSAGVWVSGSHPYPPSFFRTQTAPVLMHATPKMTGKYHGFVSSRNDCPPATGSGMQPCNHSRRTLVGVLELTPSHQHPVATIATRLDGPPTVVVRSRPRTTLPEAGR